MTPRVLVLAALSGLGERRLDADMLAPAYRPPALRAPLDLAPIVAAAPARPPRRIDGAKRIRGSKGRIRYRRRVRVNGRKVAVVTARKPA